MMQILSGNRKKGEPGYTAAEKKRRALITAGLFAIPLAVYFTAWIILGTRETVWTVITAVSCLPACRAMVGLIMIFRVPAPDPALQERLLARRGRLTMAFEMYLTFYEKNAAVEAGVFCGNSVVLLSTNPKTDGSYIAGNVTEILKTNGYRADVKVVSSEKTFTERMDAMNENYDSYHEGLKDRRDERYEGFSRDEIIRDLVLRLAL